MQARLSAATIEPEPTWAPTARSASNSYGVSAKAAGRMPPDGPPTRIAFRSRSASLPARATMSRSGVPIGTSATPPPAGVRTETRIVPGLRLRADRGEGLGAVGEDPRDGGEGLDVLDDRRAAEQAARRGLRRALLGLAALALEGLEQDGLLAEHVGALDGPDRRARSSWPEPRTSSPAKPRLVQPLDRRLERPDRVGRLGPDGDDRLVGADREGGDQRALEDAVRVPLEERPVGLRRRVGAVAVRDDDAAAERAIAAAGARGHDVRQRRQPRRRATSRRSGSRRRRGRAAPMRRPSRSCPSEPSSRIARREAVNAPAARAASRSSGSAVPRGRRIAGQDRGVRRIVGIGGSPSAQARASAGRGEASRPGEERGLAAGPRAGGRRGEGLGGGRLEPQVAVVRGGAVDHRVPGAGLLADQLQRRRPAGGRTRPGSPRGSRASASGRGRSARGSPRAPRGGSGRSGRRPGPGPAGRTGAGRTPRAARRTSPARPSGCGSGPSCRSRPCRCTRSGRPGRTGSTSRT